MILELSVFLSSVPGNNFYTNWSNEMDNADSSLTEHEHYCRRCKEGKSHGLNTN